MSKLNQVALAATLAVAVLAAFHQTRLARDASNEAQKLRQEDSQSARQIANLQEDLADANKRLDDLMAENARLKDNPDHAELLKLRNQVTQLQPLQNDVVSLQKMLRQSSLGLAEWKTTEVVNAGRTDPLSALQSFIYFSDRTNLDTLRTGIVGDDIDPPSAEEMEKFLTNSANFSIGDFAGAVKVVSQNWLSADKVKLQILVTGKEGNFGVAVPFTFRKVDGEWKMTIFNVRDKNGKINEVNFFGSNPDF